MQGAGKVHRHVKLRGAVLSVVMSLHLKEGKAESDAIEVKTEKSHVMDYATGQTYPVITIDGFSPIGPAAQAGFQRGDRIVGVNGVNVRSQEEFYETLWRHRAGEVIKVSVERNDRVVVISVQSVDRQRALNTPSR